ncbi:hypothetical protein G7Y89_g12396 [Cudoniella acicularis]|uniref:GST C-terminal domain-containing protein n=1 Tax=Cudoniella acicularis TaxID=354080 RepID=A0A8H4RBH2_9HELO|nr:hypothetical protein G7Y89_g12396 [Cudoniella acicularis]
MGGIMPVTTGPQPLKAIVIGAGIAGLTAAAALRRAGHSSFANELGAAIHVGPNATRALQYLGYDVARLRGIQCQGMTFYNSSGELLSDKAYYDMVERFGSVGIRVLAVTGVKELALGKPYGGIIPQLHLASRVVAIDADMGVIELANGEKHQADLIVGADGVHSVTASLAFGAHAPYHTGTACYRFIINAEEIYNDPDCLKTTRGDGRCRIIMSANKRVVIYPCRNGEMLNFVCMYPGPMTEMTDASSVEALLQTFADFGSPVVNCLRKAQNVKCWQLLQRDPVDSWIKGKVCLIGDAAHPMLPHLGQGGGQAIEDAVSLAPIFRLGLPYTRTPINLLKGEQKDLSYHSLNPFNTVPTLTIVYPSETITITQFLPALYLLDEAFPSTYQLRSVVRTLCSVIASDMQPVTNLRILSRVKDLAAAAGQDEIAAATNWAKELMKAGLEAYEAICRPVAGNYSVGDEIAMADVCLVPAVWGALRYGVDVQGEMETLWRVYGNLTKVDAVEAAHWQNQEDAPESLRS